MLLGALCERSAGVGECELEAWVQAETVMLSVMGKEVPAAMIYRISDWVQVAKYLLTTWYAEPRRRRMMAMYDPLEDANFSVR